jgi:hypothetical protein
MSNLPLSIDTECVSSTVDRLDSLSSSAPSVNTSGESAILHYGTLPPASTDSNLIASPPAIRKESSLSTVVTTVVSNKLNSSAIRNLSLEWHATDHDDRQICFHHSESMYPLNDSHDHPPIREIRIPNDSKKKRRCLNSSGADVDCHSQSAPTSQDLSNSGDEDFDSHNDMSDYKTMYFSSEREKHALRGQVLGMQEANRKLKRQLIEMQKQIYAYSRNKHRVVTNNVSSLSQSPWSIPVVSYLQQPRNEPIVRVRKDANENSLNRQKNSSTTPTSLSNNDPTSGASKSVSMSVSSEEGNSP